MDVHRGQGLLARFKERDPELNRGRSEVQEKTPSVISVRGSFCVNRCVMLETANQ